MILSKLPRLVLNRLCWRSMSSLNREVRACQRLMILTDTRRNFSTSRPVFDKEGPKNQDPRWTGLKVFAAIYFGFLIYSTLSGSGYAQVPDNNNPNFQPASRQGQGGQGNVQLREVSWNDFYYNMLQAGEVESIQIVPDAKVVHTKLRQGALYKGQPVQSSLITIRYPPDIDPEAAIREFERNMGISENNGIDIKYTRVETINSFIRTAIFLAIFLIPLMYFRKHFKVQGGASGAGFDPFRSMKQAKFTLVTPQIKQNKGVKFSDVAGLKEAKVEVMEFVDYLKAPGKYEELGAKCPKGAILLGPPGCGKTMLAKALANESNVPFLSMNGSEFIEMIGGLGAARVRDLFAEARKQAPAIVYIDEIDAIGKRRTEAASVNSNSEQEQTLNQLLVEMDGIGGMNSQVIMLASTNRADILDKALLRPGRFDRQITIDLPTVIERKEILEQHMKGVNLDQASTVYSERLATLTPGFSGADLANLVNEAALHAARVKNTKVTRSDLEYAIERVIAGPEKKTNVLSPDEKRIVAYHESGHAIVGWMLKHTDALLKVTILPRTSLALGFAQYTPQDKKLYSPEEIMDRMCMALGGRVAESLTFNKVTTGAQNDLEKVTKMAYSQIQNFGFNETIGLLSFEQSQGGQKPYSKKLQAVMDQEARQLVAQAYKRTEQLLIQHSKALETMAEALLKRETLNYDDVEKLLGQPPHGKKHLVSPIEYEAGLKHQSDIGSKETQGV